MKSDADNLLYFYIVILIPMVIGLFIGVFYIGKSINKEKICHDNGGSYIRDYGNHESGYICAKLEIIKERK